MVRNNPSDPCGNGIQTSEGCDDETRPIPMPARTVVSPQAAETALRNDLELEQKALRTVMMGISMRPTTASTPVNLPLAETA